MKQRFWLSYDLGLRGNYSPLYEWLDRVGAKECGDSVGTFLLERTREQVGKELREIVTKNHLSARLYLLGKTKDQRLVGGYVVGKRKVSPWAGFGAVESDGEEEEA